MAKEPKKSKRFEYNLQSVLKVRKIREMQEQEKFVEKERIFKEEERKEQEMIDQQKQKYNELRDRMSGEIQNFQEVLMRKSHLEILKEQVEEQKQVKKDAEEKKEEQREELIKAVKDKKIIEKDKEKKKDSWKRMMDKEHNKFIDDIATTRFEHKRQQRDGNA